MAYQIAFDLCESDMQHFLIEVRPSNRLNWPSVGSDSAKKRRHTRFEPHTIGQVQNLFIFFITLKPRVE